MSFKQKYTIIIKFTQNDNIVPSGQELGWVDYFSSFLKHAIAYRIDAEIDMIHKSETDLISAEDFNHSDLILYILSPAFIFSSNINKDAEALENAFNFDIPFINNKVKKVFKAPVEVSDLPLSISTPTYYRFFDYRESDSSEYNTYEGWNTYDENIEFWSVFADVLNDAFKLFSDQKLDMASKKIFISNKSPKYFHYRNNIKRELNTFGIEIFPDEDFSIEANYMDDPEAFFMQKCDLSLHFPDEFIDLKAADRNKAFEKLPNKKRYIWFNPLETLIPEKKAIYNDLKIQLKPFKNIEAIESPIEELKEILKSAIFTKSKEEGLLLDNRNIVYVISDTLIDDGIKADLEADYSIQSKYNLKILSNVENVADYRLMHYELLRTAHKFLIIHLKGNQEWLKTMISEVKKSPGFDRDYPISGRYICLPKHAVQPRKSLVEDFQIFDTKDINSIKDLIKTRIVE